MTDCDTTRKSEADEPAAEEHEHLVLRAVYPDTEISGAPVALRDGLTLGRLRRCDVVIDLETVSREHAKIVRDGTSFQIRDLDSANGTHVNGERRASAPLTAGSIVRIGRYVALVQSSSTPAVGCAVTEVAAEMWGGPTLQTALAPALRAATSAVPIEISGETGTGKELVARALHLHSGRRGPFHALNCAAIPEAMVEGELFGYRRGAFSGAERSSPGHFRAADGGSLLLDEIDELSMQTQAKLLRVIQEGEVVPLGAVRPVPVDVRLMVAGQSTLESAVRQGRLRQDLSMRLRGVRVELPPLRERIEDIPALFVRFLQRELPVLPRLEAQLVEALCLYPWPGNVRELQAEARRLCAVHPTETVLRASQLSPEIARFTSRSGRSPSVDEREPELVRFARALRVHDGIVARASRSAGISRQRAYRILNGASVAEFLKRTLPPGES